MQVLSLSLRSLGQIGVLTAAAGALALATLAAPAYSAGSSTGSYQNTYAGSSTGSYSGGYGAQTAPSYGQQVAPSYGTQQPAQTYIAPAQVPAPAPLPAPNVYTQTVPSTGTGVIIGGTQGTNNYVDTGAYVFPTQ